MLILRIIAGVFFLLAAMALASDMTRTTVGGTAFSATSIFAHLKVLAPQLLITLQQSVSRNLHPVLWDPVLLRLLMLPAWFLLGAIGLVFARLGRRQRRVNVFIN